MSQITRRNLAYMGLGLPLMLLSSAAISQESGKPRLNGLRLSRSSKNMLNNCLRPLSRVLV
jgi:hypothetical protein